MEIFKAYDIRGKYPSELNENIAYKIGRAFAAFLKCRTAAVGMDMRSSSGKLFDALAKGITDSGADVIDIGMCTTPLLYFAAANYDAGIMITASHNTSEWNGFKMCREKATPLSEETGIMDIKKIVMENKFSDSGKKGKIIKKSFLDAYIKFALGFAGDISGMKIAADAGNGVAGITVPRLFENIDCELTRLYFEPDGNFPNHEANPLKKETLADLQKKVVEEKADFGVAFDGDADRCCFIDEKGRVINNDLITALIAKEFLKQEKNLKILYDLRSSWIVKEVISENKGIPIMCRVGHAFIKKRMRDENAVFAGELSGHFYFKSQYFTESELLPVIMIMNLICREKKKISELIEPLRKYFSSGEINSNARDKTEKIKQIENRYKDGRIIKLDGLSVEYDDWWFNVRASNTEPLLRLNVEAKSRELMEEKKEELLKIIRGE